MPSKLVGGGLRLVASMIYGLAFCAAGIILGVFSYFLAKLHYHSLVRCSSHSHLHRIKANIVTEHLQGLASG